MTQDHNITLITGGTGSFGKTMLRGLLETDVDEIRVFSRDEEKQDALRGELSTPRVRFFIGDIRDRDSVDRAMHGVTSVFHAAALKQVPSCEFFPLEAVKTNVLGSENVIRASIAAGVRSLVWQRDVFARLGHSAVRQADQGRSADHHHRADDDALPDAFAR